jgi:hypothetical protein
MLKKRTDSPESSASFIIIFLVPSVSILLQDIAVVTVTFFQHLRNSKH